MGFMPSENELRKISEYTGGWISLVYLICWVLKASPLVSTAIDDLVESILFNAYDEPIQHFLLKLSTMYGFTANQAFLYYRIAGHMNILNCAENAFITYDEEAGIYKIHNVLLDFLRRKQLDNTERRMLYGRVGEWYLKKGNTEEHMDFSTAPVRLNG